MTLYTNLKPLFKARKNSNDAITEYLYVGMQFYRLYDDEAWIKKTNDRRFHYPDYGYGGYRTMIPINTPDVAETKIAQCFPDFLCQIMEDDIMFPSIFPDSKFFNNVPENFYGLALRDVMMAETKFDYANSPDWMRSLQNKATRTFVHECVELLVDKEKLVCLKSELIEVKR